MAELFILILFGFFYWGVANFFKAAGVIDSINPFTWDWRIFANGWWLAFAIIGCFILLGALFSPERRDD